MPAPIVSASSSPFAQFNTPRPDFTAPGQGSEFYTAMTSVGPRRYPRVSSAIDGLQQPWLTRWIIKNEHGAFRAAAVAHLLSTALGDGAMIARADAAAAMEILRPESASERLKQNAASFGTRLHNLIEGELRGTRQETADPELAVALEHWRHWWAGAGLTALRIELRVVCALCGFGGQTDLIARDRDGLTACVDWKSGRLKDTHAMQMGAYCHAAPDRPDYALTVSIPHTPRGKVKVRRYEGRELAEAFGAFGHALQLWRWQREAAGQDWGDEPLGHA